MTASGDNTKQSGAGSEMHLPDRRFDVALDVVWSIPSGAFVRCLTPSGQTVAPPPTLRSGVASDHWLVEDLNPLSFVVSQSHHPLQRAWVTAAQSEDRVARVVVETDETMTAEDGAVLDTGWYEMTIIDLTGMASADMVVVAVAPTEAGTHPTETGVTSPAESSTIRLGLCLDGRLRGASPNLADIVNQPVQGLIGKPVSNLIHPQDFHLAVQQWERLHRHPDRISTPVRVRLACGEADWHWYELTSWRGVGPSEASSTYVEGRDIHLQIEAEQEQEATARAHERLVKLLDQSEDLVLVSQLGQGVIQTNDAAKRFLGFDPIGVRLRELLPPGALSRTLLREIEPRLESFKRWSGDLEIADAEGRTRTLSTTLIRFHDDVEGQTYFGVILRDVTEDRHHARELANQARLDQLTGLPNRLGLVDHLASYRGGDRHAAGAALPTAPDVEPLLAVYFIDLDNLKVVNDSLGHSAGDQVLVAAAKALTSATVGYVTRFGGDEFVVIKEVHDQAHADQVAETLLEAVEQVRVAEISSHLSASIGVVLTERSQLDAEGVLRNADAAMYEAKRRGKGCWVPFDDLMREQATRRFLVESSLRDAIDQNRLEVHLQPVMSIEDGTITAFESLARWGLIEPGVFVATAEESGLIVPLGRWVLEASLDAISSIRAAHAEASAIRIAVNVSGRQLLDTSFPDFVLSSIRNHGMDPNEVVLELTESVIIDSHDDVTRSLRQLSDAGVALALDDFGSGYSSLAYLRRYPIQVLKLDLSYTHSLMHDPETRIITEAVVTMADRLGMRVVAEGVETMDQMTTVADLGIGLAQGFLISTALPVETILQQGIDGLQNGLTEIRHPVNRRRS